jgi:hypothetical protein
MATTAAAAAATMSASTNFNRPLAGDGLASLRHSGIDRRQRFGALAGKRRAEQQCCHRTPYA